ncbi:3-deoxy-7-phosphoheptulonate synthase [Candidatus Daviesbacteria bacterium]|nr:3-deoxy-7-phosphoheptulonate synthase [Candidatus Daviesbacteria bacterium]
MYKVERIERSDIIRPDEFAVAGGPCAIETEKQAFAVAQSLYEMEIRIYRGQLWKPRSSRDSFQGIGLAGIPWLNRIKRDFGMVIATEIVDKDQIKPTIDVVDIPWIGSRNMQNFELLKAIADDGTNRPVILKRGASATIKEWLQSADYIGRERVILCERGVRTSTDSTRYTLDLNGALVAKHDHGMPVIGDPSHPAGRRDLVLPLARAIVAAGLDGMVVEIHTNPEQALSDKDQQITPETFREMLRQTRAIYKVLNPPVLNGHHTRLLSPALA